MARKTISKTVLKKKLLKRAKLAARILAYVPFIRMISINGSLATGNIKSDSDIDFFIITEKSHLWTTRFFTVGILSLLRLRAKGTNHNHKICLNHFLSNQNLSLSFKNRYNALQYSRLKILLDIDGQHQQFIESNAWMKRFIKLPIRFQKPNKQNIFQEFLEYIFKDSEYRFKERQLKKIKQNDFYKQSDSVKSFNDREFYFYTDVKSKWKSK